MSRARAPLRRLEAGKLRWRTMARHALGLVLEHCSRSDVAAALGVTDAAVSAWVCGVARPAYEIAAALEDRFGIAIRWWAEAPRLSQITFDASRARLGPVESAAVAAE